MPQLEAHISESLLDCLPTGITVFELLSHETLDFRYLYFNKAIHQMLGGDLSPHIGKTIREVAPYAYEGNAQLPKGLLQALETEEEVDLGTMTIADEVYGTKAGKIICVSLGYNKVASFLTDVTEIDSLTHQLASQQQLLKAGEAITNSCSWIFQAQGQEIQFTSAFTKVYGLNPKETTPKNAFLKLMERVQEVDQTRVSQFWNSPPSELPASIEYRYTLTTNKNIWLRTTLSQVLPNGGLLGVTQDITQEQQNIRELENSLFLQKRILATSPEIIYIFDIKKGVNIFANKSLFAEFGYTVEQIQSLGDNFFPTVIHPEDLTKVFQHHGQTLPHLKEGEVVNLTYRMQHAESKEYIWLQSTESIFELDEAGNVATIVGIARNIHPQKSAEQALARTNADLQQALSFRNKIMATTPDFIYIYDLEQQRTIYKSRNLYALLGYSPEDLIDLGDRAFLEMTHPEDLERVVQHYQAVLPHIREKQKLTLEARYIHKETKEVHWFSSIENVFEVDQEGNTTKVIGISRDITEKKLSEANTLELAQELEQLVYSVSHDLRAPVRHIETYADEIKKEAANSFSPEIATYLDRIIYSANRLGDMTDELLVYSRNRNAPLSKSTVDVHNMVLKILEEFRESHPEQRISWEVHELPPCVVDPDMMRQVWENLISNAIKYSSKKETTHIVIEANKHAHTIEYAIHDNGAGFDPRFKDKLFAVFQRLHKRKEFPGHGIGLANVARIIHAHKGQIRAEGKVGEGASFYVSLPK